MRIRVSREDVEYYAKAHRDSQPVRFQGQNWRVLGISVDAGAPQGAGRRNQPELPQWWVEMIESDVYR